VKRYRLTLKGRELAWRWLDIEIKTMWATVLMTLVLAYFVIGCSVKAGGWSVCFLDHTNLELSVQHPHGDPNGPQD